MGAFTTIVGFGAGYLMGATKGPAQLDKARQAVGQKLPGALRRGEIDVREVREVMTAVPQTVTREAMLTEAARMMADGDVGDVLVIEPGTERVIGIVTDRDITIRAIAADRDPSATTVGSIVSTDLETVAPTDSVDEAMSRMRAANVRRLPVVQDGKAIGVVSLGDLSRATDQGAGATLADLTMARPDR